MMKWICIWIGCMMLVTPNARAQSPWPKVAAMDWSGISPGDFDDSELEIPYLLHHFHRVANAVVETGEHRGFLDLPVNRDPKDNKPYNARILENNLALAYFYTVDRPWNRYRGDVGVRARLEAMLDFWCRSQNPETGLFAEYSPDNWSMAPTGFGVVHMSRTLELLHNAANSNGPAIDAGVLERTRAAQRKAIMALLTREDMFRHASSWSNQLAGVYRAALIHLQHDPNDAELRRALHAGAKRAVEVIQSPTGFLYEAGGMDIGYSSVHERFIAYAYHLIQTDPTLTQTLRPEEEAWGRWLSFNLLKQPGDRPEYFVNASAQTRTSHAYQELRDWPQAEHVESWRAFMLTDAERIERRKNRREVLQRDWPKFPELVVPSSWSYTPSEFFTATSGVNWCAPSEAERATSIASLPYLSSVNFNTRAMDTRRGWAFDYIRRPSYYACLVSGKPQQRQGFGLGTVWNDAMGIVIQGVAGTENLWGTRIDSKLRETEDVAASIRVGQRQAPMSAGWTDLPKGDLVANYSMPAGEKTITFAEDSIRVRVRQTGAFTEQIPLIVRVDDDLSTAGDAITLRRGKDRMILKLSPKTSARLQERTPALRGRTDYQRVMVLLDANDALDYVIRFESEPDAEVDR